jgi:hypothetical protein
MHAAAVFLLPALIARGTPAGAGMDPGCNRLIELDNDIGNREDGQVELPMAERALHSIRKHFSTRRGG